jgi:hypothetical protein
MSPQEISKRYKRQSLGCPRGTPSSSAKIRSPYNILYFYCFMHYMFFLERLYFYFQFCFILFAAINGWTPTNLSWRRCTHFSVLSFNECSLFLKLRLAFIFALIYVQILLYLCIKVYLYHWSMLVFINRVVSKRFEWCWKREKVSCKKLVQKGACLDCGLDFCMPYLMSFW